MAQGIYVGINNTAKKIKKVYIGDNNIAKKVKKIYIGDSNNIAKLVYSSGVNKVSFASGTDA
jgi:hypothetical protein